VEYKTTSISYEQAREYFAPNFYKLDDVIRFNREQGSLPTETEPSTSQPSGGEPVDLMEI